MEEYQLFVFVGTEDELCLGTIPAENMQDAIKQAKEEMQETHNPGVKVKFQICDMNSRDSFSGTYTVKESEG